MEGLPPSLILGLRKQYPCPECGRNFNRKSHLVRHQRLHTGEKPYKCPDCGKNFRQSTDVNTHRRIHTGEMPYHCNECGKSFRYRTGLVKHLKCHEGEKPSSLQKSGGSVSSKSVSHSPQVDGEHYICTDCKKKVQEGNLLVRVSGTDEPYGCPDCGKRFSCSFQLIQHRSLQKRFLLPNPAALCSLDPGQEPLLTDQQGAEEKESSEGICEACDDAPSTGQEEENLCPARSCQTLLGRLQSLDPQWLGFEKWTEKPSGTNESESLEDEEIIPAFCHSEGKHHCFGCGQSFLFESHLVTHECTRTGEKPFQCSTCQKRFYNKSDLNKHQKVHSVEKPYKCLDCGRSFHHQLTFIRHQRLHPGERACKLGRVYFAVLPPCNQGAEVSAENRNEPPPEAVDFNFKQNDPDSLWTMELREGTQIYLASP